MIDVVVALADSVVARGFQAMLDDAADCACLEVVGERADIRPAVRRNKPDILLLDVAFRRADADLLPDLLAMDPAPAVLVYVDHGPDECVVRQLLAPGGRSHFSGGAVAMLDDCCLTSLKNDARGCLARGADADEFLDTVRRMADGEIVAGPWLTMVARSIQGRNGRGEPDAISPRELEVMVHLADGLSNKEIAERMEIREQTVKNHVSRTMAKLGASSRLEVGLLAAKHKLRLAE